MRDKYADFFTERGGLTVNVGDPKNGTVPLFVWKCLAKDFDFAVRLKVRSEWESGKARKINAIAVYVYKDDELEALAKTLRFTAQTIDELLTLRNRRKRARKKAPK
jgi:hypothetical protein